MGYQSNGKKQFKKDKQPKGLYVEVYNNNIEGSLKKFKRMIKDSELLYEVKQRKFYEKPSDAKRINRNLAKIRNKYSTQKQNY